MAASDTTSAPVNMSPIQTFNMRFRQTRIDHLRIKLEHHKERYESLELKEVKLTMERLKHDQKGLLHFYFTSEREKTREALERTKTKLEDLKKKLEELLEQR